MVRKRKRNYQEEKPAFVRKLTDIGTHRRIVKNIGSIVLLKAMAERMGIREMVDARIPMQREHKGGLTHGQVVEAVVINRCHAPMPLYEIEDWAHDSGIADLYGVSSSAFNDDRIRSTLDLLWEYEIDFQSDMVLHMIAEFEIPVSEVLYDITSLYFEGDYDQSKTVVQGYSRDNKPDKKQVNLGLTVTKDGSIPLQSTTMPGNTADPATVEDNVTALRKTIGKLDFLQITDGGMLTPQTIHHMEQEGIEFLGPWGADTDILNSLDPDNIKWAELPYRGAKGKSRYWAAELGIRITHDEQLTEQPAPKRQPGQRGRLPKHPVVHHTYWERAILIKSSSKQARDEKRRTKHITKIEETLDKIKSGLNRYRLKTRTQVQSRLDRLFSGFLARYRGCVRLNLDGPDQNMELDWSWDQTALERIEKLDGVYILITNRKDSDKYPAVWALKTYKKRNAIEQRYRDLKSNIRIRPLFVHTDERIQALVWLTVVALQLYSLIEWEARNAQQDWTTRFLKKHFDPVGILQVVNEDRTIDMGWVNLMPYHVRILEILGLHVIDLPERLEPFG